MLSIVLHGAEAAVTAEHGVPAGVQCSPGQTGESQPGCPFPVLLLAQPVPAGTLLPRGEWSCREPRSGHAQQGQDLSPEGKAPSHRGRCTGSRGMHTPDLAGGFLPSTHCCRCCPGSFTTTPLPAPAGRDISRASASKVSPVRPASSGGKPGTEKPSGLFPSPAAALPLPSRSILRHAGNPPPPQTYNLLVLILFSKKPRRRGDRQLLAGVGGLQEPCSHPSMSQAGPYAIAFPQTQGIARRDLCRAAWKQNKPALELCKIICHSERLAIWVAPSLTLEDRIWARMPVV